MSREYDQIIYNTAIAEGFTPTAAKFVVAQARFESADYTSRVFRENLNTSGMKYVGQPLATKGSLSPEGNYYAKFRSVEDSAKDKISRNYNITMKGVTPEQLKTAQTPEQFASLLKKRGYYGAPESEYAAGLKAKLLRVQVVEFVSKNKNLLLIGVVLVGIGAYLFYLKKKGLFKK